MLNKTSLCPPGAIGLTAPSDPLPCFFDYGWLSQAQLGIKNVSQSRSGQNLAQAWEMDAQLAHLFIFALDRDLANS